MSPPVPSTRCSPPGSSHTPAETGQLITPDTACKPCGAHRQHPPRDPPSCSWWAGAAVPSLPPAPRACAAWLGPPRAAPCTLPAGPGRRPCSPPAAGGSGLPGTFCTATRLGGSGCGRESPGAARTSRTPSVGCRGSPGLCHTPSRGRPHPHGSHLHHVVWDSVRPGCQPRGDGPGPQLLPICSGGDPPWGSPQWHHLIREDNAPGSGWQRLGDTRDSRETMQPP